ncbi:MAG: hypothetical protein ACYC46_03545 [Acidobacteriaceae bacterium]
MAAPTTEPGTSANAPLSPREAALLKTVEKLEDRVEALEHTKTGASSTTTAPADVSTSSVQPAVAPIAAKTQAAKKMPATTPESNKPKVKVYGRVELDTLYSSRETNPLDPRQFNGYSTAAGPISNSSATFNPRFTVIGLEATGHHGSQNLDAKIETDFYSTDSANDITPRLRLAYVTYTHKNTEATFGMDWLPVASLLPDLLDFSIMGYTGNVWQRLPQLTVRQKFAQHWEILGTAFRAERGFTLQPAVSNPFADTVKMPYIGTRLAYQNWGIHNAGMVAVSGAYRQFGYPSTHQTVHSDLLALELVVPVTSKLKWNSKIAHGQGLGDEFFRFGQALNGATPIKTTTGWTELAFTATKKLSFASGFGLDNPLGKDLVGISNNSSNYHRNARFFADGVYDLYQGVSVGLELNYLHTNWTDGSRFTAYQPMASFFYTF